MKAAIGARIIEENANTENAADAVFKLAGDNDWINEGSAAERFLKLKPPAATAVANRAALDLIVAWHGVPIGDLVRGDRELSSPERIRPTLITRKAKPGISAYIHPLKWVNNEEYGIY